MQVTFTKKAATEMVGRLEREIPGLCKHIFVGTFHSIAVRWLKIHGKKVRIRVFVCFSDLRSPPL
jgi:superfamily I DNA/RNA helicase